MENYEARRELRRELAEYKKAYRKNELGRENSRYLVREILALEQLLHEN